MRGLRGRGDARPAPGAVLAAAVSRRRALSRDQPVTSTTASRIRPLSCFAALAYAFAYFVVTSARDRIDNPLPMPQTVTATRAFLREARTAFRGHFS